MEQGLDPPCLELGTVEHRTLVWLGGNTNEKQGLVLMAPERVVFRIGNEFGAGEETLQLLDDAGFIRQDRRGESFRWEVLVRCGCSGDNRPNSLGAADSETILREALIGEPPIRLGLGSRSTRGVKSESVQNTVTLARDYFPQVMGGGIRGQSNWPGLARGLKLWKINYGINVGTMRLMMDEFAQHREWFRSGTPLWRVFLARREDLVALVQRNQQRDPSNRNNAADWSFPRRTHVSYSTA